MSKPGGTEAVSSCPESKAYQLTVKEALTVLGYHDQAEIWAQIMVDFWQGVDRFEVNFYENTPDKDDQRSGLLVVSWGNGFKLDFDRNSLFYLALHKSEFKSLGRAITCQRELESSESQTSDSETLSFKTEDNSLLVLTKNRETGEVKAAISSFAGNPDDDISPIFLA